MPQLSRKGIELPTSPIRKLVVFSEKAKADGVYKGRPNSLDHDQIRSMRAEGMGATAIARELGCSRGAVYKCLNG